MLFFESLKPSNKPAKPLFVADIETSSKGELLDIGFYDGSEFKIFQNWIDFIEYLPKMPGYGFTTAVVLTFLVRSNT